MRAKLPSPLVTESRRERALMAASKKTRQSRAKKATRKSTTRKPTPRKAARSKAAKASKRKAGKGSPRAEDIVYSDLRKIALARALARR
jgi:ABC-type branched-subunit amino acid transport system ATPase component